MKIIPIIIILLVSTNSFAKERRIIKREYSVATNLRDKLVWKLNGSTLTFKQNGESCDLRDEKGQVIYTWKEFQRVSGAVSSENGKVLLVRVMTAKGFFHGVTRFVIEDGLWKIDEVMLSKHQNMKIRDRWIHELGAVSDDGATAIFHIGEADSDRSPQRKGFRMFYEWQTWDLKKTLKIGTGLKMSNGKRG